MSKKTKLPVLHPGGIAIVCTPSMEYMALVAHQELLGLVKEKSLDFHVIEYKKFSRGEVLPQVQKNVRLKSVYLFYDFNGDACHDLTALVLTISAIQDAGAASITLVMPYIPFFRQDRKDRSRVPISAKVAINMLEMYDKVDRIITLDMHADQIQIGFKNPSDHLPGHVIFVPWILKSFGSQLDQLVIVGPDAGSEKRVKSIAEKVGCKRAFLTKERTANSVEIQEIHGASVEGRLCLINDDIMDTCETIIKAAEALMMKGARDVILSATHPVFGTKGATTAYQKLAESGLRVITTDSLKTDKHPWLTVLPLAHYMAHVVMQNIIADGSVSNIINHGLPR